ncbi:hypothetical protein [Abyssisolibacter fermentans]|uniref:hypothetical protein n=1 Tax=Abyssisolibacter fermentans TaxID=1766203 RepID=UPI00082CB0E1|nr:hypothetical protein [Abyssisolibacter fermentans]
MPWKKGSVTFDDGTTYPADLLVKDDGEVWNMKVYKDGNTVEEIDAQAFASKLNKNPEQVYPFTYKIEE